jgi:hypothetical protein
MVPITITVNAGDNRGLPVTLTASVSGVGPNNGSPCLMDPATSQAIGVIALQGQGGHLGKSRGRITHRRQCHGPIRHHEQHAGGGLRAPMTRENI